METHPEARARMGLRGRTVLIVRPRMIRTRSPPYLWNVLILVTFLSIVVDKNATHAEVRQYRRVFFLKEINR